MESYYRGFSTQSWVDGKKTFTTTDIECVTADLICHIQTRIGERVHMNGFGTIIPDVAYEINDKITVDSIRTDVEGVLNYDPRVQPISINLYSVPDENMIVVICEALYVEFGVTENLRIEVPLDQRSIA